MARRNDMRRMFAAHTEGDGGYLGELTLLLDTMPSNSEY